MHRPRFGADGSLLLERAAQNYVVAPLDLTNAVWVKGSSMQILKDRIQGISDNYQADRLTVSATSGNDAAQTMSQEIEVFAGTPYTCTLYLRLAGGQFGPNDVFRVMGSDLVLEKSLALSSLNNKSGLWVPITLTVETAGDPDDDDDGDPDAYGLRPTLSIEMFVERSVSVDWGGAQVEEGTERTSLIELGSASLGRDQDSLRYAVSPIAGLSSWAAYISLNEWRGDGRILSAGNLSLDIVDGDLSVTYGGNDVVVADLSADPRIMVAGSSEQQRLNVYVDGILRASQGLNGYVPTAGRLQVGGDGMRWVRCAYTFDKTISDGDVSVGQPATDLLGTLFARDILFLLPPTDPTVLSFPAIRIPGRGGRAIFKLPIVKSAGQAISSPTPGTGTAQVVTLQVATIIDGAAAQSDWIRVNNTVYYVTSDATPTVNEIGALLRAKFAAPKAEPVTASGADAQIILTADEDGDPFRVAYGPNLIKASEVESNSGSHEVTVPNAADYVLGRAYFLRQDAFICDCEITAINTGTGVITLKTQQASQFALVQTGDDLVQPSWETLVGTANYLVTIKEQLPWLEIESKELDRFTIANCDWDPCWVNVTARVGL